MRQIRLSTKWIKEGMMEFVLDSLMTLLKVVVGAGIVCCGVLCLKMVCLAVQLVVYFIEAKQKESA
jgi:hypothetical protein